MKFNRRLKFLLFALLVLNLSCGILFYIGNRKEAQSEAILAEQLIPAQDGLLRAHNRIDRHVAFIQSRVLQAATSPQPTLIDESELDPAAFTLLLAPIGDESLQDNKHYVSALQEVEEIGKVRYEIYKHLGENDLQKAIGSITNRLEPLLKSIHKSLDQIGELRIAQVKEARTRIKNGQLLQSIALISAIFLTLALGLFMLSVLSSTLVAPLTELLLKLSTKKMLPVPPNELGQIAEHVNKLYAQEEATQTALTLLSQGQIHEDLGNLKNLDEKTQHNLGRIRDRLENYLTELHEKESILGMGRRRVEELQTEIDKVRNDQQTRIQHFTQAFLTLELNENGKIVAANERISNALGVPFQQLKDQSPEVFLESTKEKETFAKFWKQLKTEGKAETQFGLKIGEQKPVWIDWTAVAHTLPVESAKSFYLLGKDVNNSKQEYDLMKKELLESGDNFDVFQKEMADLRHILSTLRAEKDILQKSFDNSKQLEYRLLQQQAALQNLTRNPHLKAGRVKEALRTLTEATSIALDEDRASIWLLIEKGETLRCLDSFDRRTMKHLGGQKLALSDAEPLFKALSDEMLFQVGNTSTHPPLKSFYDKHLNEQQVIAIQAAPITLAGKVVGCMLVEHIGTEARDWAPDEQNFLIAAADIVSLALEQGNRKAMEEELRLTLEESQALDEELRQNAEEIEATNEEMRRTQIELRGQINALNNAAIVSETSLEGNVTYANKEFLKVYKYEKQQVMGKNLRLLKTNEHNAEFFANMWQTITNGKVWEGEVRNQASDRSLVWVSLTITPVLGLDGKPFKYISVSFDISRQKQQSHRIKEALQIALEQEELLRQNAQALMSANEEMRQTQIELDGQINALNHSSLVYETDMEGNITAANEQFLRVSNYTRDELIGNHYTLLQSGRQPDSIYTDLWRKVASGETWRGELEFASKAGVAFWVVSSNNPVFDEQGEPFKSINVLFDITEQKLQEFRLKKQQSVLLELNTATEVKEGNVKEAFLLIARRGMETLGTKRTSIWMFIESGRKVRCTTVVQNDKHEHAEGTILDTEMYPIYFRTLDRERYIAATDAVNDTRTKELAFTLFKPYGVASVLDTTIRQGTRTVGIISFEHEGEPREWTLDEQSFASSLADTISLVLEQKERQLNVKLKTAYSQLEENAQEMERQKKELEETTRDLMHSIKYSKRIQTNILPNKDSMDRCLGRDNYFVVHRQRDTIGGDFYWFDQLGDKQVIVVADGTGHGVPGAFLTLIGYLLLSQIVVQKQITNPSEILYHLHIGVRTALKQDDEEARNTSRDGMDVAICTLDTKTYMAEYAGANLPFYYYQDWEIREIKPTKKSIGGEQLEEERIFDGHDVQLKPGDAIYMYTDGFVDQFGGPDNKRFSTKRFRDLVLRTQHESMSTQRAMLNMEWKEWKDDREQLDDVTVCGVRVVDHDETNG